CKRVDCTAGPLLRLRILPWMEHVSAARPMNPPSASISLTRWPLATPPTLGLHGVCPTVARLPVTTSTSVPIRAAANAASSPAWPAPTTSTVGMGRKGSRPACAPSGSPGRCRPRYPAPQMAGFVSIVGAGPWDPYLLTLAGRDRLQRAEVVIADYLVNPALLLWCPPDAEIHQRIAGPRGGALLDQEKINALLVEKARAGRYVVRLKGG